MNSRLLPSWLAMGKLRMLAMVWACGFYGYFAALLLADKLPALLGR